MEVRNFSDGAFPRFMDALKARHIAVSVRRSRGLEADAACGQLRASQMSPASS